MNITGAAVLPPVWSAFDDFGRNTVFFPSYFLILIVKMKNNGKISVQFRAFQVVIMLLLYYIYFFDVALPFLRNYLYFFFHMKRSIYALLLFYLIKIMSELVLNDPWWLIKRASNLSFVPLCNKEYWLVKRWVKWSRLLFTNHVLKPHSY